MADYAATARTNYFRVKDLDAFRAGMPDDVTVSPEGPSLQDNPSGRVCLLAQTDHGSWPCTAWVDALIDTEDEEVVNLPGNTQVQDLDFPDYTEDEDQNEDPEAGDQADPDGALVHRIVQGQALVDFSISEYVCERLAPGELAYGLETGAEKLRYVTGFGWATDGEQIIYLDLEDALVAKAEQAFGTKNQTLASY